MSAEAIVESTAAREFLAGMKSAIPVMVASAPFGLLFGAVAVDNGLDVVDAMVMSAAIFGGASQMVGLDLFGQQISPWLVVLSIFAVNFRHVLYSAAIGHRLAHWTFLQQALGYFLLTDPQYAEAERRAAGGRKVGFVWYMGMGLAIYVPWVIESGLGAMFGKLVPDTRALGIDFLLPIYFFGMLMDFRKRPHWLPIVVTSAIASVVAYLTIGSPWHVSVGAVAGIALAVILPVSQGDRRISP